MKKFIFSILILLIALPCFGAQTIYTALEQETVAYQSLPSAAQTQFVTNENINAIKYGSGVVISGLTVGISSAGAYLFLSNPSVDLRWLKGFYLNLNDGAGKNLKVLVGEAGTGETLGSNILATYGFTSGWSFLNTTATTANSFTNTAAATGYIYKAGFITASALYKGSLTSTQSIGGTTKLDVGSATTAAIANGQSNIYKTAINTTLEFSNTGGLGNVTTITAVNLRQVLTPSGLGAWFSTPAADAGVNLNAASFTATATRN